jgi:hypothetical protein
MYLSACHTVHCISCRYINARDMFGNDCLGSRDIDEFTVDVNGNPVELYVSISMSIVMRAQRFKQGTKFEYLRRQEDPRNQHSAKGSSGRRCIFTAIAHLSIHE